MNYDLEVLFFSGVPLLECCLVINTSSEHSVIGLAPGRVDPSVGPVHISVGSP